MKIGPIALFTLLAGASLMASAQAPSPSAPRPAVAPSRVQPVDRIVAVVNDEVITSNELSDRVGLITRQLQRQGGQLPPPEVITQQILEKMVNDMIQVQLAKESGIKVDDATLERTIDRIAQENNLSRSDFRVALERDGIKYPRFREDIRSEIMLARLREREVENAIVVTDAEVETELAREAKEKTSESEFRLSHILVLVAPQATAEVIEQRRRRAVQALGELRKGGNFAQVAAAFSDAPDALQGGTLGWRPAARLPTLFTAVLEKLEPGEASDIIRSPNGFHIIKLLEKRGKAAAVGVQQTHVRHILLRAREGLSDTEARDRLARLRQRIEQGADFAELARVHSEDATAPRGGDLGWITAGDTVPEFERAMNALAEGAVSQPIQTPFGWHLVQVVARRSDELSEDRKKLAARQAIRARKADEAFQDWLRQARDRAFVENRLEER